jgi:hypothetical protein
MPLYYLHIRNRNKLAPDPEGIELPDIDAALSEALRVARELLSEVPDLGRNASIEIADRTGQIVLTVPFSDAINPRR